MKKVLSNLTDNFFDETNKTKYKRKEGEFVKIRNIIVAVLCIAVLASCFVFALAASGSEQVGGGQWSWETIPGFRAKSAYMHPELFHGASAQVGAGEIVRKTATAGNTAVATAWGFLGTCRVWWNLPTQ